MISKVSTFLSILLLAALPVLAHHPFSAEYDWKKPVTVSGTVTKLDWANPHAHVYVDAIGTDGKQTSWNFELGGINALTTAGWTKSTLKTGDMITVEAWLAKSQANMGNVKSVTLSNGRELSGGSSIADPNANEPKSSDTKSTASR
jgi:uncharacterized protein DUF6152